MVYTERITTNDDSEEKQSRESVVQNRLCLRNAHLCVCVCFDRNHAIAKRQDHPTGACCEHKRSRAHGVGALEWSEQFVVQLLVRFFIRDEVRIVAGEVLKRVLLDRVEYGFITYGFLERAVRKSLVEVFRLPRVFLQRSEETLRCEQRRTYYFRFERRLHFTRFDLRPVDATKEGVIFDFTFAIDGMAAEAFLRILRHQLKQIRNRSIRLHGQTADQFPE